MRNVRFNVCENINFYVGFATIRKHIRGYFSAFQNINLRLGL